MIIEFDELTEEQKKNCYETYKHEIIYEYGDFAVYRTYEEWCEVSKILGEPLGVCV